MLEEHVAYYLEKYLGDYVKGLSKEALKISAWQGNVELTNMQLKPEALNALKLPIKVKAGFLGSVKLKVPWSRLGKEPVIVLLDRIFVLAEPETTMQSGDDDASIQEAKRKKIRETELAMLDARLGETDKTEVNNSWLGSLISTIIGNLKLSITNIHIRYEDSESNAGHPFAAGLTLEKLAAVTVDESGKETFITSGPLDRIQKAGELQGLALYLEPDTKLWSAEYPWDKLGPVDWSKIFEPRIKIQKPSDIIQGHYLLQPVGASARYMKLGTGDSRTVDKEMQRATLNLNDVTISLSQAQYRDLLKLAENVSVFKKQLQYAHLRPANTIKDDPKSWWKYACRVVIEQQKKASGRMSWDQVVRFTKLCKKYVSLYINRLQSNPQLATVDDNEQIQEIEKELDVDVAVQWRMLAHSYVDKSRKDINTRKQQRKGNWWSFFWGNQSSDDSSEARSLTEEDWKQINEVIGYQEGNDSSILPGQGPPDMLHTALEVNMHHNATKLVDENGQNIMELSAEELQCGVKLYREMKLIDFKLGSYKLSSPEGLLAESETRETAIDGQFTSLPLDKNVDWSLSARALPCYITYLKSSVNEVVDFFQSSSAVSQTVVLETAAALQATLDEVARNAQQQINEALKEKPRFSLLLDIAAPKIIVPSEFYPDGVQQSKLLLDLGHFSLQTEEPSGSLSVEESELYMHFKLGLSDVQIFLIDGKFDWREHYNVSSGCPGTLKFKEDDSHLSLLERCGITVALQQICVPHPGYPSTRLAVRLPSLGFHFSPARYHRMMQIFKVFQNDSSDKMENSVKPWDPADFEGEVSVLCWKGVGNREAVWQRKYVALAGPFLYILDAPSSSSSSKRRVSLIGKQVIQVPPESIGGVPNVLAVCDMGHFNSKVAESASTLLLRFDSEDARESWQGRLQSAIYRFSAPAAVNGISAKRGKNDSGKDNEDQDPRVNAADKENLFLTGVLDELKIVISSGSLGRAHSTETLLLAKEHPLIELRALGSKVEFVMKQFDMAVGAVLQALEIEDKLSSNKGSSERRYLARSDIVTSKPWKCQDDNESGHRGHDVKGQKRRKNSNDSREMFFDTEEALDTHDNGHSQHGRHLSRNTSDFYDADDLDPNISSEPDPPKFERIPGLLPELQDSSKIESLKREQQQENFVKAQVILYSLDSPAYENVDKKVLVSLATLSFFCFRPTIVALLDFADAINADVTSKNKDSKPSERNSHDTLASSENDNESLKPSFERKDSVIKGLLGSGKDRVLFLLVLNMHKAMIILNTEDGAQLASLDQEDLNCEIQVFPSSFGIMASLGNLRITDGSVDGEQPYYYICDTRNPGSTSFIELEFFSFNKDDNDYEGYEYSLVGKLSEIRFVYLNRFIQEISAYFMGLVPQSPGYVVRIDNKDVEKFFTQSEVEGMPGIKLDVLLRKPIIVMPRSTRSRDFIELDILEIKVKNSIEWIGDKENPGAIRLDTTNLHIEDIHMSVGVKGESGEGIIKDANGLSLKVTRTLRDLWHQLPGVEACIKIEELKADLSDKEYQVITECALNNLSEKANLPPASRLPNANAGGQSEDEDKVGTGSNQDLQRSEVATDRKTSTSHIESQNDGTWTTIIVIADIEMVELSLFKGTAREQALATAQVSGVWVAYRAKSNEESNIMASLKSLSVKDDREGTEPVLQYMIGKADDVEHLVSEGPSDMKSRGKAAASEMVNDDCHSPLTMLVMDAKLSSTTQIVSLRVQQPKLLVAVDFLLAVAEFFVPSIHTMVSDSKDIDEESLNFKDGIYLDQPVFKQQARETNISPKRPLIADSLAIDNYVYDGRGGSIILQNEKGTDLDGPPADPLVFIGNGKHLRFMNVIIQGGDFLDSCILLGVNSSYTILEADGVFLKLRSEYSAEESCNSDSETDDKAPQESVEGPPVKEIMFDLQAIGPELTFYDSMDVNTAQQVVERLIRAKMDVFSRFVLKGSDLELNAKINGLSVEASSGLNVVEPVHAEVKYSSVSGKQDVHVNLSEVYTNFSFSVLQLVLKLQEDISSFLRITTRTATVQCYRFDKIWMDERKTSEQCITFWRPRAPPGFAILGDCITPSDEPLAKGVLAVNMSLAWFKRPVYFEKIWSSEDQEKSETDTVCCVWMPIAPTGYVPYGCVVTNTKESPPLSCVVCISERMVTTCSMKDCIVVKGLTLREQVDALSFWRVDNSVSTFFLTSGPRDVPRAPYELRHVKISQEFPKPQDKESNSMLGMSVSAESQSNDATAEDNQQVQSSISQSQILRHIFEPIASFKLVWWNKNADSNNCKISIWRPIVPPGRVFLGDVAVEGYEPPSGVMVLRGQPDVEWWKRPLYFEECGVLKRQRAVEKVSFWYPVAPPGYSPVGCIAALGDDIDQDLGELVGCVRNDLLQQTQFLSKLWTPGKFRRGDEAISIWLVDNVAHTFIVHKGVKPPPQRLALAIVDVEKTCELENLGVDAEVKALSVVIYDDFRGLMAPLLNLTVSSISASSHGRLDALSSTVNFSFSAQSYNGKCYAWEPLIEPFDGFVRHEFKQKLSPVGPHGTDTRLKFVSTTSVNANVSITNLNMMLEAYTSWNKLSELMEISKGSSVVELATSTVKKSALDFRRKKSFQVIHHNKLGEDLLIRCMDINGKPKIVPLPSGQSASLELPTSSSILDPNLKGSASRYRIVTILIGYAEVLHDGKFGEQRYTATLRIYPQLQTSDKRQLEQQSVRTRAVVPNAKSQTGTILVEWNEVFSFEVGFEESCVTEMMVTELATGSAVGYCSFTLSPENDKSMERKREDESRPVCVYEMQRKPLVRPDKLEDMSGEGINGEISYAIHFFPETLEKETKPSRASFTSSLRPGMIQVSYRSRECWTDIGLNYAARAACWQIGQDTIATETVLDDGKKQLIFRSLIMVVNATDFPVDLALSLTQPSPNTNARDLNPLTATGSTCLDKGSSDSRKGGSNPLDLCETEEVFENERYQPLLGWGSTWPGHFLPTDPKHWSKCDYSCPNQEFPEPKLPLGWEWKDNWKVDKTGAADEDGWSYGFDFKTLTWPTSESSKRATSFVRRRRWIRTRGKVCEYGTDPLVLGSLEPLDSAPLPVACLRPDSPDYMLQINPHEGNGDARKFRWSEVVLCRSQTEQRSNWQTLSQVSLRSLAEAEQLLCCMMEEGSSSEYKKSLWFVLDVQAKDIGMNSQLESLKDWRMVLTAPLTLYNFLPVASEYIILEKCPGMGMVVRERGVIKPGEEAQVFYADIRKVLHLSWIPQGGWQPEDAPVVISHPHKQGAKRILFRNYNTGRVLQVFIDHCTSGKELVAKRMRFYVPCWLDLKKLPSLHCKFVELKDRRKLQVCFDSKANTHEKVLELIKHEEMNGPYTMISTLNLEKMGISAALASEEKAFFAPATPLGPLNLADGYVELRALDETGEQYYKIFVSTELCPYQSVPTKVLLLRPFMTFTNRVGESIQLKHTPDDIPKNLNPSDWRISYPIPQSGNIENLQVRLHDSEWCFPLTIKQEETFHVAVRKTSHRRHHIRVEVRGYEEDSRFLVVFRRGSSQGPYRLENCMRHTEIQYRQSGLGDDAWQFLKPLSADLYAWENPFGEQYLEVHAMGENISCSDVFDINKTGYHYFCGRELSKSFYCHVLELGSGKLIRFRETDKKILQTAKVDKKDLGSETSQKQVATSKLLTVQTDQSSSSQLEIQLDLGEFGLSVIDLKLQEMLYLYMRKLSLSYTTGYAGKARRIKLLLGYLQLDNQLPLSALPVILAPEEHSENDCVLKMTLIISDQKPEATEVYPYVGIKVTKSSWRVNIHEPIIWAIMDFYNELQLDQLSKGSEIGQVDPEVRIDLLDISEVRLKLTLEMAPRQRPRGVLGIWSPLVTALGNTSKMPIHLRSVVHKNRYLRKSQISRAIVSRLSRDLIHNPLMLLSGLDVLGMTSSTLATLSETVAELSSDGKFLQLRSKQDRSRRIGGVSDGLVQGTEAIAQGVAYGVSGVITKPMEKAKEKGLIGFVQGLGKAAVGIVMEPMSGVLDFVSLTVNGVGATCTRCFEFFEREQSYSRVRLPRAIQPDGILRCYDGKAALGQAMLQLAEGRGRFRQGIFFREPSKFAWSDFYVDHFDVVNHKAVIITNKRVMLLQQPKSRKIAGAHVEPPIIMWDVPWEDLLALELACTANDEAPVFAILHMRNNPTIFAHLVKCSNVNSEDTISQTRALLMSISRARRAYGPSRSTILQMVTTQHLRVSQIAPSRKRSLHPSYTSMEDSKSHIDLGGSTSQNPESSSHGRQNGDTKEVFNFEVVWTSDQVAGTHCPCCIDTVSPKDTTITIWRPIVPEGYVAVGDIARLGKHPPFVSISYKNIEHLFARPTGFDLVWRSWKGVLVDPVSIWMPRAPDGYIALGCVVMASFVEPEVECVWCAHSSLTEDVEFEEREIWHAPNGSPWGCFLYQVASEALTFMALRRSDQRAHVKPKKIVYR